MWPWQGAQRAFSTCQNEDRHVGNTLILTSCDYLNSSKKKKFDYHKHEEAVFEVFSKSSPWWMDRHNFTACKSRHTFMHRETVWGLCLQGRMLKLSSAVPLSPSQLVKLWHLGFAIGSKKRCNTSTLHPLSNIFGCVGGCSKYHVTEYVGGTLII